MKKIIIILFVFANIFTNGQDSTYYKYNNFITKAEQNDTSGQYADAIANYDFAFNLINCIPYHYYDAFSVAIADSNFLKAKEYLIMGTLKGLDIAQWNSQEIDIFNKTCYAKEFYQFKDSLLKEHFKTIDIDYFNSLQELMKRDQKVRSCGNQQMLINDSLNFEQLIILSTQKGFPTFQKTGYGYNIAFLILFHNSYNNGNNYPNSIQWQRIIPFINKEIKNGTIDPNFYKQFIGYKE